MRLCSSLHTDRHTDMSTDNKGRLKLAIRELIQQLDYSTNHK